MRTPIVQSVPLSPSDGDHVPQSGQKTWGIKLVAELGTHWAGLPSKVLLTKEGVRGKSALYPH